ncbi:hypothetical protein FDP22_04755 [Paroceanicella profunda]|uniref:Uncharacterized protein n=1 Tax=Paroceanicella profunda TaxID=2579971 RepID=A0A5B8FVJ2_9RHOB|nr:hypothetical protein [Paroceanicella profunda]QDL91150.1 hypothetical protein FDP22_04755 [Paroceanicella profunda]
MANRFIVDLGSVKLDDKISLRIDNAIQKATLTALADHDFRKDVVVRFPREWRGIWIDLARDLRIDDREIAKFGLG